MEMFRNYPYDKKLENKSIDNWCKRKTFFKLLKLIEKLILLSVIIYVVVVAIYLLANSEGVVWWTRLIILILLPAMGSVPPIMMYGVMGSMRVKYGTPFELRQRQFLHLYDKKLEYGFYQSRPEKDNGVALFVYRISFDNIEKAVYDEKHNVITINGIGELVSYANFLAGKVGYIGDKRKFYNDSEFSFILCFERKEEVLQILEEKCADSKFVYMNHNPREYDY